MNGYAYANNNPVTNWDPTGLKSDECGSLYRCGGNQVITTKTTEYQDVSTVARHFEKTASWATLAQWKAEGLGNSPAFGKAKKLTKWKNEHYEKNWGINLVAGMARSWVSGVDAAASAIMPFPTVQAAPLYDSLVSSLGVNTKGRAYANGEGLMDGLSMVGGVGAIAAGIKGGLKMAARGAAPATASPRERRSPSPTERRSRSRTSRSATKSWPPTRRQARPEPRRSPPRSWATAPRTW